jgi:hypothetical protein
MPISLQAVQDRKKQNEAQHINNDSSSLSTFTLYFTSVIDLLVLETIRHYHQHLDRHDGTPSPLPDITNSKMFLFQAIIVQIGHDICDRLRGYWTSAAPFFTPLYPNTMTQDHFLHILRYIHFTDNDKEVKKNNNDNYDRPWNIKEVFDSLDVAHSNFYNPTFGN